PARPRMSAPASQVLILIFMLGLLGRKSVELQLSAGHIGRTSIFPPRAGGVNPVCGVPASRKRD
ncbi:MAG: hypothetical protein ACXVJK_06595, partial [Candidatus Aminicenantales bacterium]